MIWGLGLGLRLEGNKKINYLGTHVALLSVKRPSLTCFRRRVFNFEPLLGRPCLMCYDLGGLKKG